MTDAISLDRAIGDQILRELEVVKAKYGADHFEVLCIEASWGDTIDDRLTLRLLRSLNRTGSMFKSVVCRI